MKVIKCGRGRGLLVMAMAVAMVSLTSCGGLLLSSDFGFDDYGPSDNWYWSPNNGYYNGLGGYLGPSWNLPPVPPAQPVPPSQPGNWQPNRPNGANKPNFAPENNGSGNRPNNPTATAPSGVQRPGNMGQGPSQSSNEGGSHRGR